MKLCSFILQASTMFYLFLSADAGLLREKPVLTKLELYNSLTNAKVADLVNGMSIDMSVFSGMINPSFNVVANGNGRAIRSVRFGHNDESNVKVENKAPFAFCGNKGNVYFPCTSLGVGNHTVTATPYSFKNLKGARGETISVTFSILADVAPTPPYAPSMSPLNPPAAAPVVTDPMLNATKTAAPVVLAPVVLAPVVAPPVVSSPVVSAPRPAPPVVVAPSVVAPTVAAPTVAAPTIVSPTVVAPTVVAPTVVAPTVVAPTVVAPMVVAPTVVAPAVVAPAVVAPAVVAPAVAAPKVLAPTVSAPKVKAPTAPMVVVIPTREPYLLIRTREPFVTAPTIKAPAPQNNFVPVNNGLAPVGVSPSASAPALPQVTKDIPNLTNDEIAKVMNWIKLKVTQVKNPFCWKPTYGRNVGLIPTACPPGKELIGDLCYSICPAGYARYGFDCHQLCPGDSENQGLFCRWKEYGRGAGYPWQFGDCLCNDGMLNRCGNDNGGRDNCEMYDLIAYPKCKPGYSPFACCICRPNVPDCTALGMNPGIDLSCAKKIIIGDPTPSQCTPNLQYDAGLCYPFCKEGYYGVGPLCWNKCATGLTDCGAACAKDVGTCALAVLDQVLAPLILAANIATLGLATPATGAASITIKTASGATQAVAGTTKLGKAFVKVVDMLQSINPAKEYTNVLTRIYNARTGSTVSTFFTTIQVYSGGMFALEEYRQAFATDFAGQTSAAIDAEINRHYLPATATFLKGAWADIQLKEMAEANAWETANGVLPILSIVDITGVTGLVSAYAKPICKEDFPFPCISGDLLGCR